LSITGPWASSGNEGYVGHPSEEQKLDYANPFRLIYGIENVPFQQITLQQGIIDFSERILGNIFQLNQNIIRIKDIETFRRDLVSKNFNLAVELQGKLEVYKANNKERSFEDFLDYLGTNRKSDNLKELARKLCRYYEIIHFTIIGSRNSGGMKQQYHEIEEELEKLEKRRAYWLYLIYFILSFFAVILVDSHFHFLLLFNQLNEVWFSIIIALIFSFVLVRTGRI